MRRPCPPIDTGGIRVVQHTVDRSQGWKKRVRGGRRHLTHPPIGAAGHPIGERRKPAVLTLPQAHGQEPAAGIARALRTDAVDPEPFQQERIVLPRPAGHLPPVPLVARVGVGRQNAGAGSGGPAGATGLDHGDLRATGGELVRRREPDQPSAGDGHIDGRGRHDRAPLTSYDAFSGAADGAALRASGAGGVGAASWAFIAASSASTDASLPTASSSF